VTPAYRWPADDLAALAGEAGFTEVGRPVSSSEKTTFGITAR
jgi:hypothetical protein